MIISTATTVLTRAQQECLDAIRELLRRTQRTTFRPDELPFFIHNRADRCKVLLRKGVLTERWSVEEGLSYSLDPD